MLVFSRKVGEAIRIANDIVIVIRLVEGDRVSVAIEAPKTVRVLRAELQAISPTAQGLHRDFGAVKIE